MIKNGRRQLGRESSVGSSHLLNGRLFCAKLKDIIRDFETKRKESNGRHEEGKVISGGKGRSNRRNQT